MAPSPSRAQRHTRPALSAVGNPSSFTRATARVTDQPHACVALRRLRAELSSGSLDEPPGVQPTLAAAAANPTPHASPHPDAGADAGATAPAPVAADAEHPAADAPAAVAAPAEGKAEGQEDGEQEAPALVVVVPDADEIADVAAGMLGDMIDDISQLQVRARAAKPSLNPSLARLALRSAPLRLLTLATQSLVGERRVGTAYAPW